MGGQEGGEPGGQRLAHDALLAALRAVPGVVAVDIDEGEDPAAGPGSLRLQLAPGADDVAVAAAVNEVLRRDFDLSVDADRVEVVEETVRPPQPARPGPAPTGRAASPPAGFVPAGFAPQRFAEDEPAPEEPAEYWPVPDEWSVAEPRTRRSGAAERAQWAHQAGSAPAPAEQRGLGGAPESGAGQASPPSGPPGPPPAPSGPPGPPPPPRPPRPPRPTGPPPGSRPPEEQPDRFVLERATFAAAGLGSSVTVTLSYRGRSFQGSVESAATPAAASRAVALATLRAVEAGLDGLDRVGLRADVDRVELSGTGPERVALAVIGLVTARGLERHAGAAVVVGDSRQAVIKATLAAVNRRLELMLGG